MSSSKAKPLIESTLQTVLSAAVEECNSDLEKVNLKEEALDQCWSSAPELIKIEVSKLLGEKSVLPSATATATATGASAVSSVVDLDSVIASSHEATNLQWNTWESRLLSIGSESLSSVISSLKDRLASLRSKRASSKEDRLKAVQTSSADPNTSLLESTLTSLRERARQARAKLEASRDEDLALGEESSQLLEEISRKMQGKASGLSTKALPSDEKEEEVSRSQSATELEKELRNLRLTIGVLNRLSWCKLTEFTTSVIRVSLLLSDCVFVNISFSLHPANQQSGKSGSILVSSIEHEVITSNATKSMSTAAKTSAIILAKAYYEKMLCGSSGPLSKTFLSKVLTLLDVQKSLKRVSAVVFQ
jgi:vacuolar-type H+-ATPase subunit I/STV1